jgi:hypothetical protein
MEKPPAEGEQPEVKEETQFQRLYRYAYNVTWTVGTAFFVLGLPLFIALRI